MGGRSLTIGGPSNLIPDTPLNIRRQALYRKDLAVMTGITKDDGTYLTTRNCFFQFMETGEMNSTRDLLFSVIYDILDSQKLLNNKPFMQHHLIDTVLRVFGMTLLKCSKEK